MKNTRCNHAKKDGRGRMFLFLVPLCGASAIAACDAGDEGDIEGELALDEEALEELDALGLEPVSEDDADTERDAGRNEDLSAEVDPAEHAFFGPHVGGYGGSESTFTCDLVEGAPLGGRVVGFKVAETSGGDIRQLVAICEYDAAFTSFLWSSFRTFPLLVPDYTIPAGAAPFFHPAPVGTEPAVEEFTCADGEWVTGVHVTSSGGRIESVEQLLCGYYNSAGYVRNRWRPVYAGTVPQGASNVISHCLTGSGSGHQVTGMRFDSGWLLDGFRVRCDDL